MNNFREINQKGGLAEIKIDHGYIYEPKNDRMIANHGRYCDGRLYCETGYRPFGCHECIKIHSNSDDIDDEINSMRTDAVSRRGGRRRRKTRRQRKSRRRQRKSRRTR